MRERDWIFLRGVIFGAVVSALTSVLTSCTTAPLPEPHGPAVSEAQ